MHKFPEVPTSWEEFKELREYLTDCDVAFLRKSEDQARYKNYEKSLRREEVLGNITSQMEGKNIAILKNQFPHTNVLQNLPRVSHYCLWSIEGELGRDEIERIVNKAFSGKRWFYMTRKKGKFSIPEIWHTHIYVNEK